MRMKVEMNLEMKGLKTATMMKPVGWVSESDEEEPEWGG